IPRECKVLSVPVFQTRDTFLARTTPWTERRVVHACRGRMVGYQHLALEAGAQIRPHQMARHRVEPNRTSSRRSWPIPARPVVLLDLASSGVPDSVLRSNVSSQYANLLVEFEQLRLLPANLLAYNYAQSPYEKIYDRIESRDFVESVADPQIHCYLLQPCHLRQSLLFYWRKS